MNANESESFGESQPYFRVTVALPSGLGWIVCVPLGAFYRHTYIYIYTRVAERIYTYIRTYIYIVYDARTVAFIFGRERERGRGAEGEGVGSVVSNSARERACMRACVCTVCHEEEDESA